jgi:ATP-dependent DNA helicase DinG
MTATALIPTNFADAEKVLKAKLPGYERRPQQTKGATFVEAVLAEQTLGLMQAGTGVGKSLATMIPAILSGLRVIIATATIALQEQYANKDVPFLQANLGVPFKWALLKGRSNYFCEAKAASVDKTKVPLDAMRAELDANPEHSGDREHFSTVVTKDQFRLLASTSNECPGKTQCPFAQGCFAEKAKTAAKEAQLVVTNTALLATDTNLRRMTDGEVSMLGEYDAVIIDEAHELEEIVTNALTFEVKRAGIVHLLTEVDGFQRAQHQQSEHGNRVMDAADRFWDSLPSTRRLPLSWFVENQDAPIDLINALQSLAKAIRQMDIRNGDARKGEIKRRMLAKRASNYATHLGEVVSADDSEYVRWTESETRTVRGQEVEVKIFKASPISVAPFLKAWLWERVSAVLVSATLTVNNRFDFVSQKLGLEGARTLDVGTPFDYSKQALLFTPAKEAPSPKLRGAWLTYATAMTQEMVEAAGGGALLLFTSDESMQLSYKTVGAKLRKKGYTVYMQGEGFTNKELAQRKVEEPNSVLLALKSFMTGVSFEGECCRLVVIDKMPFAIPGDPIVEARTEIFERNGGKSFFGLTIPNMTLVLLQAFGRAIRRTDDRAVVAILDSRLATGWGSQILRGLPPAKRTTSLDEVKAFYR